MNSLTALKVSAMVGKAMEYASRAAEIQMKYYRSGHLDVETKFSESDIVTKADRESEKVIIDGIQADYPDHNILSEESGRLAQGSDWIWVIDPLDGTTNYTAGLPLFGISIGIRYKGETVGACVYVPVTDEMFTAIRGVGAYLNGEEIHVRDNDDMARAVVSTGFPVDKDTNPDNNLDNVTRVLPKVRGLRRLGAASVDLCYVAAGVLDAYWEMNLHEWDICAGALIVELAGGIVHHFRNDRCESIIASSPGVYGEMRRLISGHSPE